MKEYISWLTKKEMKKNQVMGVSIAIVDNQRVVWAQGFGYADIKNKVPATPETVCRIGSISKLFTVMATMQLAEQGKVDIDQPLNKYLPQFSVKSRFPDAGPITPRSMMTHHSGLPNDVPKGALTSVPPSTLLYRLKDEYVAYPTNYVLAYSNVAMALLGLMVEQVSDTEFSEHLNQSIFGVERKWLGLFSQKKIGALELTKIRAGRMDVAGRELLIVRYDGRHWFTAEKIDPLPLPETWENALGKYEVMNSDPEGSIQDITLSREEDLLVFAYTFPVWSPGKKIMYFTSISETEAITLGIGRNSGETMRIVNMDNQKGIYFLGFKMKKSPS